MKGTAVQSSRRYVRERFGEGPLARVIEALPEGDRVAFGHGVYYESGELRIVESGTKRVVAELAGLEGGATHERIYGWMQHTLELAGARNLRSAHSACVHHGDSVCRFEGSWE